MSRLLCAFIFVLGLTFLVWYKVLNLAFLGESAVYFQPTYREIVKGGFTSYWNRHDVFALFFFYYLGDLIKDNFQIYYLILLFLYALVNYALYLLVWITTKSHKTAIFTIIIFVVNYFGSFELLGMGFNYPTFLQRVATLSILLSSMIFLHFYHTKKLSKFYFVSIVLYIISLFLAHFNLVLLPLFLIQIILHETSLKFRSIINIILKCLPYLLISYILISRQTITGASNQNLFLFAVSRPTMFRDIMHVMTITSVPKNILIFVASVVKISLDKSYSLMGIVISSVFILIGLKEKKLLFWSVLFSIPIVIIVLIYINGSAFVNQFDTSRYFYIPSMLVSIIMGICLVRVIRSGRFGKLAGLIVLTLLITYNIARIDRGFDAYQEHDDIVNNTFKYVSQKLDYPTSQKNLVLVSERVGRYNAYLLTRVYGKNNFVFVPENTPGYEKILKNSRDFDKIIRLEYKDKKILETEIKAL